MHKLSPIIFLSFFLMVVACTTQAPSPAPNTATASSDSSTANLVFSPYEVSTEGWLTYSSEKLGISVQYPRTFVVSEDGESLIIKRNIDTTSDKVTLMKVKSTLLKEVGKRFYHAMKIDRDPGDPQRPQATIVYYQSGEPNSWFMTYYITREADTPSFPDYREKGSYDIVVADVEAFPPEADTRAAREINRADEFLSEPQQILSTLRFTR